MIDGCMKTINIQNPIRQYRAELIPAGLFNDIVSFVSPELGMVRAGSSWTPSMNIEDGKDSIVVELDAPGMRKEDFSVSWHDGLLTISGERKEPLAKEGSTAVKKESFYGTFQRSTELNPAISAEAISASYKDGVLTVTLPKSEEAKPRKIEVGQ
jgi:HSP20 family protein